MRQGEPVEPLGESVGYVLKQAQAALHHAMDAALRPCGLTVSQYSCLELLDRGPGQSHAQLARGAFVTRQSMNEVLRGLQARDLVQRPGEVATGRARPTRLTSAGHERLDAARAALSPVLARMVSAVAPDEQRQVLLGLRAIVRALEQDADDLRPPGEGAPAPRGAAAAGG